ncbi:1-hydroxy-2-methyl-2-butenyl 4-diphosphate reductase [Streptomyces spongiicola]|uniref:1-hydroxy-2-methyl-2-butenyl 4-diphosphate reductase n=1 Tax=Streptomyces spongiicola TaxID=1690221 RepID=A0A2S1Z7A9_9ACTN|nr:1-hydroxy-2-methyl-2-butenyl 4-diphosphate reductase [Streptomyces spongiicola]AWK12210.1 1-hydroxy-2-methyl-2-butenyl 4-diphosphate reductase [Streptomyces spongiicola]GBQ02286.1 1-hydroxy-2-methyl-2-butenyl 4-diphosphate reductase [Streptomyces spongiicola]
MAAPGTPPAGDPLPPLLIACALGIERLALRAGARGGAPGPVTVLRTGMGPRNAERALARALGDAAEGAGRPAGRPAGQTPAAVVIAAGFCAGLAPGMHPGDVVVADETRGPGGITPCTAPDVLAEALAGAVPGRTVHTGPLTASDHVVRGQERAELAATGAIAVDMESAATLHSALRAGVRPVAAVRVVVDAPEHELVRIGTVRGGISAFRVLRAVIPAFYEWRRSLPLPRR